MKPPSAGFRVWRSGWLLVGYYTLPWYDLQAWIPLCLLAASALDVVLLIRTTIICLAYISTRTLNPDQLVPGHLVAITRWIQRDLSPWVHVLLAAYVVVRLRHPAPGRLLHPAPGRLRFRLPVRGSAEQGE